MTEGTKSLFAMSKEAREHFKAGRFSEAAALHAEARTMVETADPSHTVTQLNDGRLVVMPRDTPGNKVDEFHAKALVELEKNPEEGTEAAS